MFQYLRGLYRRHRKKLIFATGFAAVSYLIGIYVSNKINKFQEQLREENATRDLIKKRFSQTQKDCYMTFLSFLPVLIEPIYKELDVEQVTKELKLIRKNKSISSDGKSELNSEDLASSTTTQSDTKGILSNKNVTKPSKSKIELWQELKIKSLTRFLTLIYSETLLIILLHLQLNIISRKSYLKTAFKLASKNQGIKMIDLESSEDNNNDPDNKDLPEQAFLSFTWWLLNRGSMKLKGIVNDCVEGVFDEINLRDELNIEQFGNLIFEVQKSIDSRLFEVESLNSNDNKNIGKSSHRIISLVLPPKDQEFELLQNTNTPEFLLSFNSNPSNTQILQKMNNELKEYLDGDQVCQLIKRISAISISSILGNVDQSLHLKQEIKNDLSKDSAVSTMSSDTVSKWKLAFILAVLTPQTNELANRRIDNKVLFSMNNITELDELSASVYSNFDL
jgi:peroxin-3